MLIQGDCLEELKKLESESVDSLVTDPPAGISFMGKTWDSSLDFIPSMTQIYMECLRVLKPGGHGLVWAIPRTSHWTATALEDAGFEIRDVITHIFGSGFPKSHDISKAINKAAGAEREVVSTIKKTPSANSENMQEGWKRPWAENHPKTMDITALSITEAKQWSGWGTALKPASEHWILIRKQCSEKTVAQNVLKHGCGGLNIDASRIIGTEQRINKGVPSYQGTTGTFSGQNEVPMRSDKVASGRFPSNLILSHNESCVEDGVKKVKAIKGGNSTNVGNKVYGKYEAELDSKPCGFGDSDGTETVAAWECTEGCPVAELDRQSGFSSEKSRIITCQQNDSIGTFKTKIRQTIAHGDSGGASRFFYCAKASKSDKNNGLEDLEPQKLNHHPTVKSTKLMQYLIRLITPPGGTVLDPFMGSGSTGVAAKELQFKFIGIEKEKEYFDIALKRIEYGRR